jgi:hypothetical protein
LYLEDTDRAACETFDASWLRHQALRLLALEDAPVLLGLSVCIDLAHRVDRGDWISADQALIDGLLQKFDWALNR